MSSFEDVNWPRGNESPAVLALERDLRKKLGRLGYGLIGDKTAFTDSHYRGGYAITNKTVFIAGRNFDLSLMDVVEWAERAGRRKRRNRA